MKMRYKFLKEEDGNFKSVSGNQIWKIGKWYSISGDLKICENGFHCSQFIQDAMSWVRGNCLAQVSVQGSSIVDETKECWESMKIVKTWDWTPEMSVKLGVFAAEQALPIWEKEYPDDNRPRKAIEAAKAYFEDLCGDAADAAAYAVHAAAYAAYAAAYAVHAAAENKIVKQKIHEYCLEILNILED